VHRLEFLLSKYVGAALLLVISVFLMGLLFLGVVALKEQNLTRTTYHETIEFAQHAISDSAKPEERQKAMAKAEKNAAQAVAEIHKTAGYGDIVKALATVLCKLLLIAAMTLFLSTFATSMVFTVVMSAMLYFCGHLVPVAQQFYDRSEAWLGKLMALVVNWVLPNLAVFDVADDLFTGLALPWLKVLKIVSYGAFYVLVTLTLAHLVFRQREI
jgi:ABC-type transport system involved in multi-copper enzyme maturation permease subunit